MSIILPPKKISGIVTDEAGNLLEGAHVYYNNGSENIGVTTNADGEFFIKEVPSSAVVKFSYAGVEVKYFTYAVPSKVTLNLSEANTLDTVSYTHLTLPTTPYV